MSKQHTIMFVKQSFESEGYQLLSTEYKNAHQYLHYICPNGHEHKIKLYTWIRGQRCGKCHYITYEQVRQSFEDEGYQLLSTEYKNNKQLLDFICSNGHYHKIRFDDWNRGSRCGKCNKTQYDYVKKSFIQEGYKLLSTEFIDSHTYLDYICPNGHQHKIIWANWQQGVRCGLCHHKWSKAEKEILKYIENIYTGTIIPNDRTLIMNPKTNQFLELDIWLPEIRKAIEYNGIYWHDNKYQKYKDNYKQKWCKENGIELLVIDHRNWITNKDFNIINNFIKN